jgi:hypothetical protein
MTYNSKPAQLLRTVTTPQVGGTATVEADGQLITGRIYHVRENGWPCVKSDDGHVASGPCIFYSA